jgi:hypothetical protein
MLNIEHEDVMSDEDGLMPVLVPPHMKVMSMAFLLQDPDTRWSGAARSRWAPCASSWPRSSGANWTS